MCRPLPRPRRRHAAARPPPLPPLPSRPRRLPGHRRPRWVELSLGKPRPPRRRPRPSPAPRRRAESRRARRCRRCRRQPSRGPRRSWRPPTQPRRRAPRQAQRCRGKRSHNRSSRRRHPLHPLPAASRTSTPSWVLRWIVSSATRGCGRRSSTKSPARGRTARPRRATAPPASGGSKCRSPSLIQECSTGSPNAWMTGTCATLRMVRWSQGTSKMTVSGFG
mmetsp:Transcript_104135/g.269649  ORF Transcript_104135/g.269649 Transcript_104135/m.269649 type:complete len:221 (-) Transcript_104135:880-1542(-)